MSNISTNGSFRKIATAVVTSIILFMAAQILLNSARIAELRGDIKVLSAEIERNRGETLLNRTENREEHQDIIKKIDTRFDALATQLRNK